VSAQGLLRQVIQMAELRLNRLAERVMVMGGGGVLVGGVAALDDTVRGRLVGVVTGDMLTELSMAGMRMHRGVRTVAEMVGYQTTEHGSLTLFAVAALVLFVLTFRT